MSFESAKEHLYYKGLADNIIVLAQSSATVEEAAAAVGCESARIAKTLSFLLDDKAILIVTAGDAKVDNKKYKDEFNQKARMIPYDFAESYIGHKPGGICPFAVKDDVSVYLDKSLKRFDIVYPACGDDHSAVALTLTQLEQASEYERWVDVCKGWEQSD